MTTEDIELERTGRAPLHFRGHVLTTACGQFVQTTNDKPNADHYTLTVYRADENTHETYVVQIVYMKVFRGTQQHHTAIVTSDPAATLAEFNPLAVLIGFPPHENYAERQLMLETKCRRQYDLLASAVLKMFPEEIGDSKDQAKRDNHILIELPADWPDAAKELIAKLIDAAPGVHDTYGGDWHRDSYLEIVAGENADFVREIIDPYIREMVSR